MSNTDVINNKILDILIPSLSQDFRSALALIGDDEWDYILERGREHRFLPLMHWTLEQADVLDKVPHKAEKAIADARRRSTLRALAAQREILLLHRLFADADIPHVFLKGAYLSQFAYPHPGLRPVRDIDVVVAPDCVSRAFTLMAKQGYVPITGTPVDVEAYVKQSKHLPGLLNPSGSLSVEVHSHVDAPGGKLARLDALQNVTIRYMGNDPVPFMDPTDQFIYLCVHAADFHTFNNGPLIIADIGFLLQRGEIDLYHVASRATELGVMKSVTLTLALTDSCWQVIRNDIEVLFDPIPEDVIQDVRQLCFRSFAARSYVTLVAELSGEGLTSPGAVRIIQEIFPSPTKLVLEFGPSQSPAEYIPRLMRHWGRLATEKLPAIFASRSQQTTQAEISRVKRIRTYLQP